ncbi:MAG: hypothetical protein ABMB14_24635 [Myxococcota bacterium]
MRYFVLLGVLVGCVHNPTVPVNLLAQVPPDTVQQTEPLMRRIEALDSEIAVATRQAEQARSLEAAQAERVDALDDLQSGNRDLKRMAVERGDATAATAADATSAERSSTLEVARADLAAAEIAAGSAEANLTLLQAEREVTTAELELTRAQSIGPEALSVEPFQRALDNAVVRRDEAAERAADAESAHQ